MRGASAFLALGFLALALAGCVTSPDVDGAAAAAEVRGLEALSAVRFATSPGQSVFYEASTDGVSLHLRLWLPVAAADNDSAPADWKAPAILVMSPYFGPDSREHNDQTDPSSWDAADRPAYWRYQWLIDHFVPRGYAVALADVRGTGESGGCLEQTAQAQSQDGFDTVEWLAAQDWSNGKVGMYGKSYDAETQQSTATLAPPHLTTIVPVSSVSGQYEYSFYDGVPYTAEHLLSNTGYVAGDGLQPGTTQESATATPERAGCNADHYEQTADESGSWSDYWDAREIRKGVANVQASVLYVHGLQDWNVKPVAIRDWYDLLSSPKTAIFGQWAHDYPEQNTYHSEWSRQDWQELVWRWYDHWLLERPDPAVEALLGHAQIQDNLGRWRLADTLPSVNVTTETFYLVDDKLSLEAGEVTATWREPVDARASQTARWLMADGVPYRPTNVVFTSLLMTEDLHWSGWPTLDMTVTLDRDDAHFVALLHDEAPDGTRTWINRAYLSAQHRDGVEAGVKPVPMGEAVDYQLRFFPSDTVIAAGHKLVLELTPYDDWATPANTAYTAKLSAGALHVPRVQVAPEAWLDVPLGEPITAPVV